MTDSLRPPAPQELLHSLMQQLEHAAQMADHPFRTAVLTTQGSDGPRSRTIVVRSACADTGSILLHTDQRSTKVTEIQNCPNGSLLCYDSTAQVQLILSGQLSIHTDDDIAEQVWDQSAATSLRTYLAPHAPGTVLAGPNCNLPEEFRRRVPDRSELIAARANFAVIRLQLVLIEWLQLHRKGNLRLRMRLRQGTLTHADWIAP